MNLVCLWHLLGARLSYKFVFILVSVGLGHRRNSKEMGDGEERGSRS